ncbi:MAG: hypothetical protein HQ567_04825 [Candidatus Nealsonbacteria bacterium]|nr:hypothetical protein [Candidatus Nealsonbacteria bacterium]
MATWVGSGGAPDRAASRVPLIVPSLSQPAQDALRWRELPCWRRGYLGLLDNNTVDHRCIRLVARMNDSLQTLQKPRLLIVGHFGFDHDRLFSSFQASGEMELRTVEAGLAVRMAELFVPDAVLVNVNLPGMYAFAAARSILALPYKTGSSGESVGELRAV